MGVTLRDEALRDLSHMFFEASEHSTPDLQMLSAEKLDFSVESLPEVERYLDQARERHYSGRPLFVIVLRAGAYVGEVIRRHAKGVEWHWLDYYDASSLSPLVSSFGRNMATSAVLWDSGEGFCFPLVKVAKYLEKGKQDSIEQFARGVIAGIT
jgi:hypothetical protein